MCLKAIVSSHTHTQREQQLEIVATVVAKVVVFTKVVVTQLTIIKIQKKFKG